MIKNEDKKIQNRIKNIEKYNKEYIVCCQINYKKFEKCNSLIKIV